MKQILLALCVLSLFSTMACAEDNAIPTEEINRQRIGVYDSRAIAVAFASTKYFNNWITNLRKEHDKAVSEGDTARAQELADEAVARQQLAHKQAFSTAPVDDILAHVRDQMGFVMQEADVEVIISKWDTAGLAKYEDAEQIDVTTVLVDALEPSRGGRQRALSIQEHDPISLEEAKGIDD